MNRLAVQVFGVGVLDDYYSPEINSNVIGLPLGETLELLARAGVLLPWRAP